MAEYADIDLLNDFNLGTQGAFKELYNRFYEKLYFSCFRIIHNKEEAQDIVLTTLNKLFCRHSDFHTMPEITRFLFLAARNHCINFLRDQRRLSERLERSQSIDIDIQAINEELDAYFLERLRQEQQVIQLVEQLPKRSRQVVIMYYLDGMKYKEIASILNISHRSVENVLRFALDRLRNSLNDKRISGIILVGPLAIASLGMDIFF